MWAEQAREKAKKREGELVKEAHNLKSELKQAATDAQVRS